MVRAIRELGRRRFSRFWVGQQATDDSDGWSRPTNTRVAHGIPEVLSASCHAFPQKSSRKREIDVGPSLARAGPREIVVLVRNLCAMTLVRVAPGSARSVPRV